MENAVSTELVASGVLIAAGLIFLFRMSFVLWARGYRFPALLLGTPCFLYAFGLVAAGLGFGHF